ncbi:MAG TPA: DUF6468 domain-containing protein [Caulobacteraceae bacterium]|jgi:hypothetical protein|nr:DUF6468 domain-containing protein [Caulobacteraceae bacterium]
MSPIAVGLDLLLVTLLIVALVVGLRLNRRLKALRDGQDSFVRAVGELDAAAARAEAGLSALRAASEDAHDTLLTRIETARGLIARLEGAAEVATRAGATILSGPAPAAAPVNPVSPPLRSEGRPDPRFRDAMVARIPARAAPARPPAARGLDDDLFEVTPRSVDALQWRAGERK